MPTFEQTVSFKRDHRSLGPDERIAFRRTVEKLVEDLGRGRLRPGLRVKRIQGTRGIFEITWADDGRATFEYGDERIEGEPHIVWRRIGTHAILRGP